MRLSRTLILGAAIAAITTGMAFAAPGPQKPEDLLRMRQGLLETLRNHFGPWGAFAAGKGDLPADAADRAANMVALGRMLPMAWGKGTEDLKGSDTKPEAFDGKTAQFNEGWIALTSASVKLNDALKAGDANTAKVQIGAIGKTCKGCHDDFRKE